MVQVTQEVKSTVHRSGVDKPRQGADLPRHNNAHSYPRRGDNIPRRRIWGVRAFMASQDLTRMLRVSRPRGRDNILRRDSIFRVRDRGFSDKGSRVNNFNSRFRGMGLDNFNSRLRRRIFRSRILMRHFQHRLRFHRLLLRSSPNKHIHSRFNSNRICNHSYHHVRRPVPRHNTHLDQLGPRPSHPV
jgi:hypothetical protein